MSQPKVAVVMGSDSDFEALKGCFLKLKKFNIAYDARVISAHRTPQKAEEFAKDARQNGYEVIIAAAGKAAHLAGVIAAYTTLPVIGVPMKSSTMDGLDSLLSVVQMPGGIPVATVAINGSDNAGILAAEMLALKYPELAEKLVAFKQELADSVAKKDETIAKAAQQL